MFQFIYIGYFELFLWMLRDASVFCGDRSETVTKTNLISQFFVDSFTSTLRDRILKSVNF
jgi:hypothetical protein